MNIWSPIQCHILFLLLLYLLIRKKDGCANNPKTSSTTKISERNPCGYLMSTIWPLSILYIVRKVVWKRFGSLQDKNIIGFTKKKMLPLTKEKLKSHQNAKACNICRKTILKKVSQSIS